MISAPYVGLSFRPYINKGYSIEINFILNHFCGVKVHHVLIKRYDKFVFEAYWIDYPSDELILSIIKQHHRNEMINELFKYKKTSINKDRGFI
jgi:hypothetical protein